MPIPLGILAVAGAGAAAGGSAYDLLETTLITTTTASVTFSNLNNYSDYKHLQIRAVMQDNATTNLNRMDLQFNSDTGANYTYHYVNGNGSTVSSSAGTSQNKLQFFDVINGTGDTSRFGVAILDILDFSNTNKNTTVRCIGGGISSSENDISLGSGLWLNTAAVTSISIFGAFSYTANSRFSLYGVK
jgi:hypothetical protein